MSADADAADRMTVADFERAKAEMAKALQKRGQAEIQVTDEMRAAQAAFARRLSGRAQVENSVPRQRLTVRQFYLTTTALAQANPWAPPLRFFQINMPGVPRRVRSRGHGGLAA